jgi:3-phosphoshikimate 1-carboxyvinyltransferase
VTSILPDLLPVTPFTHPVRGEVILPGSKSLTNRALLLAALCDGPVTLTGALFSEDTAIMAEALRRMGFTVQADEQVFTLRVSDQAKAFSTGEVELFVGLAGTAARFLTALCAAAPRGVYRLDGVSQMRKRPMRGLIEALRQLGADIRCTGEEGFFPLEIQAHGLRGGAVTIDASESSQLLSALLMVALRADSNVHIALTAPVREPFVEMTVQLMHQFGADVSSAPGHLGVLRQTYHLQGALNLKTGGSSYLIEPDATAASYFLALPLVTRGSLQTRHVTAESLQGDVAFARVLGKAGVAPTAAPGGFTVEYSGGTLHGVSQNFREFSDTFLTLAAISPLLDGTTRITGIAHTRKQETDRVAGMARELRKLGQEVIEEHDALTITPRPLIPGETIETYGDHRFAMSFGILGCHDLVKNGEPWLTIKDPACCAKTFPGFFDLLEALRQRSLET